ncbi:CD276 antigen-like isoform 1-T1 [Anableps anableps]
MRIFWVFLVTFLGSVAAADGGDAEVSCVVMETCVLPCSFQSYSDDVIHWFLMATREIRVHSFYNDQDQLGLQDQNFSGRTSLFLDQISRGNASLLLRGVKVQDEGTYRCYISTIHGNSQTIVNVGVDAPVSAVRISQEGDRISCSSEGIYPQPELTWSTIPPSSIALETRTRVQQTEDQLYSISSSLRVSDGGSGLIYSCTVRTRSNRKKSSFRKLSVSVSSGVATIPCSASNSSLHNFSLIWRFNHNQIIVNQTFSSTFMPSQEWRKHVKGVSESGSLTLKDLSSSQEGVYTCELSEEEETLITNILLKTEKGGHSRVAVIVSCVLTVIISAAFLAASLLIYKQRRQEPGPQNPDSREEVATSMQEESVFTSAV